MLLFTNRWCIKKKLISGHDLKKNEISPPTPLNKRLPGISALRRLVDLKQAPRALTRGFPVSLQYCVLSLQNISLHLIRNGFLILFKASLISFRNLNESWICWMHISGSYNLKMVVGDADKRKIIKFETTQFKALQIFLLAFLLLLLSLSLFK